MPFDPTRGNVGLGLSLIACAFAWQTFAATPAVSVNTKFFEGTVTIDDALKASPGLVNDCLAEGKAWVDKMRAETEKERRENPASFSSGQQWSFDRNYVSRSVVAARYVSIVRTDDTFAGGAHPNSNIDTILWDREAQKRISIRPFFNETADNGPTMTAMARLARLAVAADKISRGLVDATGVERPLKMTPEQYLKDDTEINDGIKPTLLKLGPVTLAPSSERGRSSGLTFHFSPDVVGSHAEGPYVVFVPWTAFKQYLSGEGTAIFTGARPKSDDSP
jgi:hypothetical protein